MLVFIVVFPMTFPLMTPQERFRLALDLWKRANSQPNVPQSLRKDARRVARNLVNANMMLANKPAQKRRPKL